MKYSESTGGIYIEGVHSEIPEDAREISADEHASIVRTARAPAVPFVPPSVSMYQARVALLRASLLDDVQAALAALPDGSEKSHALLAWEFAGSVERGSPFVAMLAGALSLSEERLDELFVTASMIQ